MVIQTGTRLGHHEVLGQIGSGGMGEVYKARDLKLGRMVAIKVLPRELAENPELLARFEWEAKAVASLSHPNILGVFEFDQEGDLRYLVMELLEGESLRRMLERGPLAPAKAVDIAGQVAEGLAAAHAKGIVHRDLKPENIFITQEGRAKILDFGLAKQVPSWMNSGETQVDMSAQVTSSNHQTQLGTIMGTVGYMAPEQVRGESVDPRADIFAFGVVLCEMLTGRKGFTGRSAVEILHAILKDDLAAQLGDQGMLPPGLDALVTRCLEKEPQARIQSMKEVAKLLGVSSSRIDHLRDWNPPVPRRISSGRRWGLIAGGLAVLLVLVGLSTRSAWNPFHARRAEGPSIAVLPFMNLSSDKEQEYFSDGISEELLNLLSKVPRLKVIARTSSFSFKGKGVSISDIARKLDVATVLEGSVRKSGNQVRITVQLIRASDSTHLWSETYDRTLDDIFKVQDEIAASVVAKLKLTLLGAGPTVRPVDPRVYPLILQARALLDQRTGSGDAQAIKLYQEALAVSPDEARAWNGLGRAYLSQALTNLRPAAEGYRLAREASNKALALDPTDAVACARLGRIAMDIDNDFESAARLYQRALALDPTNLTVVGSVANLVANMGRMDEAIALDEYRARHDPATPISHANLGVDYMNAGRWDQAIASCRTALSLSPGYRGARSTLGECLLLGKGDAAGALEAFRAEPDEYSRMQGEPMALLALGRRAESDAVLADFTARHEKDAPYNIATIHAYRGEADKAFEWLDKAAVSQDTSLSVIAIEPLLTNLHHDPRWLPFLRRIGKAPEQLAKIKFKVVLPK